MEHVLQGALLQVAQQVEANVDAEIARLDDLQDSDIAQIRQRRLEELKTLKEKQRQWVSRGHGVCAELTDEKEFFKEIKGEERAVCHFYRNSRPCMIMDEHITRLARSHLETKFVKMQAEKSPYLTEKLKVWMLPTLALVRNGQVVDYVVGFNDLGNTDAFPTAALEARMAAAGVVDDSAQLEAGAAPRAAAGSSKKIWSSSSQRTESDQDSDFDD